MASATNDVLIFVVTSKANPAFRRHSRNFLNITKTQDRPLPLERKGASGAASILAPHFCRLPVNIPMEE